MSQVFPPFQYLKIISSENMANLWHSEDLFATNSHQPPMNSDPTTHQTISEEPFSSYPKIGKVWSINNPNQFTQPPPVDQPPHPIPLRVKVPLPDRQAFLANDVHQLELVLQYGDKEEQVLMINLHNPTEFPTQRNQEPEIATNSTTTNNDQDQNHPKPSSSSTLTENWSEIEESIDLPPKNGIDTQRSRRKQQFSYSQIRNNPILAQHFLAHFPEEVVDAQIQDGGLSTMSSFNAQLSVPTREKTTFFQDKVHLKPTHSREEGHPFQWHKFLHTRKRPHPCNKCGKKFTEKGSLTKHLRLHDPATRRHCEECDKSFTTKQSLTIHVATVHRRLAPFQCPECGNKFGQKGDLMRHLSGVHLGIRYPCRKPNCGKSFSYRKHLRQHEKTPH